MLAIDGRRKALGLWAMAWLLATAGGISTAAAHPECTHVVYPHQSIQAAVDDAAAGDVICLAEGEWEESVQVERSITLRGRGADRTIIRACEPRIPAVVVSADGQTEDQPVVIEGLKVTGGHGVLNGHGVLIRGTAWVTITSCSIVDNEWDGIRVEGAAEVVIEDCEIAGNGYGGVRLERTAQAMIGSSRISTNDWGVLVTDSGRATINDCVMADNRESGIGLHSTAKATIIGSTFVGSPSGIALSASSRATVKTSRISQSEESGVRLRGNAELNMHGCAIFRNKKHGIAFEDNSAATITRNVIRDNRMSGIHATTTGEVRGEHNALFDNGIALIGNVPGTLRRPLVEAREEETVFPNERYPTLQHAVDALLPGGTLRLREGLHTAGVTVDRRLTIVPLQEGEVGLRAPNSELPVLSLVGGADLTAEGLTIAGGRWGVLSGADARATVSECTLAENGTGVHVTDFASATLTGCTASHNDKGIAGLRSAELAVSGCEFVDNGVGIHLSGAARAGVVETIVARNGVRGLSAEEEARVHMSGCTVVESKGEGILLRGSARGVIATSLLRRNEGAGLSLEDSAHAEVSNVTIALNAPGISLADTAEVMVEACAVSGNEGSGIMLGDSALGTVTESQVFWNWGDGIVLWGSPEAVLAQNRIFGNRQFGVALLEEPCFPVRVEFAGYLAGKGNEIPGPDEAHGNDRDAVCPGVLEFLTAPEGGELDRRP